MANPDSSSSAGHPLPVPVQFKVPKAYWEPFRAGVVFDLAFDSKNRADEFLEGFKQRLWGWKPKMRGYVDLRAEDHTGPLRYLAATGALLGAMEDACPAAEEPERDIVIEGDPETIMFGLHSLANRIAGPLFAEALDGDPGTPNPKAREWNVIATWAMDSMEKLNSAVLANSKRRVEADESREGKS
jgi:hypothetical protein